MKNIIVYLIIIFMLVYDWRYYHGDDFIKLKERYHSIIYENNELNDYIEDLKKTYRKIEQKNYGKSKMKNNSKHNYSMNGRDNYISEKRVHDCSLPVLKNAENKPFKYLCKYFNLEKNEKTIDYLQSVQNDFASAVEGQRAISQKTKELQESINTETPFLIRLFSKRLYKKLELKPVQKTEIKYPTYSFRYVSAGGNKNLQIDIKLDMENLHYLVKYLDDEVRRMKKSSYQRSLMTKSLRESVKQEDDYTCQMCGNSTYNEPNLLLEIDHIMPISKGGKTERKNLQTTCWKCNRSKGSKII